MGMITEGTVAFGSLLRHDVWQGQSTEKFVLKVVLSEEEAEKLRSEGVNITEYDGAPQRKFSSGYEVPAYDIDDNAYTKDIPKGSLVRIVWKAGNKHPVHGLATYMMRVRVLEEGKGRAGSEDF